MKFASYAHAGGTGFGRVEGDRIVALAGEAAPGLRAALAAGTLAHLPARGELAVADVTLLPVVPNPAKVFCVGHNYEEHRVETGGARVGHPSIFTRFADTLVAHGQPLLRPRESTMFDYEGELAIVIGRPSRRIVEADAMAHVAGFACANDASVRDWQRHTQQFTPGKNFPATGGLGPWLVTPDEIDDLDAVTLTTRLNGAVMQQATLAQLIFPIPTIIAYLSAFTPLSPGDVVLTGTPGGVGARREPPVWLVPGDVVEVEITGVGTLANPVGDD